MHLKLSIFKAKKTLKWFDGLEQTILHVKGISYVLHDHSQLLQLPILWRSSSTVTLLSFSGTAQTVKSKCNFRAEGNFSGFRDPFIFVFRPISDQEPFVRCKSVKVEILVFFRAPRFKKSNDNF